MGVHRRHNVGRVSLALSGGLLATNAAQALLGWGGGGAGDGRGLAVAAMLAAVVATFALAATSPGHRAAALWIGAGMLAFTGGVAALDHVRSSSGTFPTIADILRLGLYPLALVGGLKLVRELKGARIGIWLDGAAVGLVVCALTLNLFVDHLIGGTSQSQALADGQLVFALIDLLCLSILLVMGNAMNWRIGPAYISAIAALVVLSVADSVNAHAVATGSASGSAGVTAGWAAAIFLAGLMMHLPEPAAAMDRVEGAGFKLAMVVSLLIALVLIGHGTVEHNPVDVVIAALVPALVSARLLTTARESERLARETGGMIEAAGAGIFRVDVNGLITYVNPTAARMLGRAADELIGRRAHTVFHHSYPNGEHYPVESCPLHRSIAEGRRFRVNNEVFWRPGGASFPVDYTCAPLRDGTRIIGAVAVFDDVSNQHSLTDRLRTSHDVDPLTGLLSRSRFEAELEDQLALSRRYERPGAVLGVDLDAFHFVNDSLGHAVGDEVIRKVADLLERRLRTTDVVGRLGSDEFAVLLREAGPEDALQVGHQLREAIQAGTHPRVTASIGMAVFDGRSEMSAGDVLIGVDVALAQAREEGGNRVSLYEGAKGARLTWVERIREAIAEDRMVLYAQPIADLRTGRVAREEALVRMLDPHGDVIPPAAFLPVAERFGLIVEIDRIVVDKAIAVAGGGRPMSINLSAASVSDPAILAKVSAAVASGLDPAALMFEITETAAVGNLGEARDFARRLANLGCSLALDDFGTGFSSLGYLKHIPVQTLKIDIEFIRGLTENTFDQHMIQAIVSIARRLGQKTVAEGVESAATIVMLRSLGVDYVQGYFIGRPQRVDLETPPSIPEAARRALAAPFVD